MVDINAIHDISTVVDKSHSVAKSEGAEFKGRGRVVDDVKPAARVTSDEIHIENVDNETVERITSDIGTVLSSVDVELQLEVDDATKKVVVKVIDPVTKEVIKQIPSKELLAIGRRVDKLLSSYSLDKKPAVTIFKDSKDIEV